jgi:hypothetical protein
MLGQKKQPICPSNARDNYAFVDVEFVYKY